MYSKAPTESIGAFRLQKHRMKGFRHVSKFVLFETM